MIKIPIVIVCACWANASATIVVERSLSGPLGTFVDATTGGSPTASINTVTGDVEIWGASGT